jgi:hypothetical protein
VLLLGASGCATVGDRSARETPGSGATALVLDLTAACVLERRPATACDIGTVLHDDDIVAVAAGSSAVIVTRGGRGYRVDGATRIAVTPDGLHMLSGSPLRPEPGQWHEAAQALAVAEGLPAVIPRTRGPGGLQAQLAGQPARILGPSGQVLDTRPELRLHKAPDAGNLYLVVEDPASDKILARLQTDGEQVGWPETFQLKRGGRYRLRLEVLDPNGGVRFRDETELEVASQATYARLIRNRPDDDAAFATRLVYAMAVFNQGYHHDAQSLLSGLARERPDSARLQLMADPVRTLGVRG